LRQVKVKARVAVIGRDGACEEGVLAVAEAIGSDIAGADCILVCGGRGGVMRAACRGAKRRGGLTVGILPSSDGSDANEFLDVAVPTGLGFFRNNLVVGSADAVIALNGSTGTLSEIAMALNIGKPVVCVTDCGGVASDVRAAFPEDPKISGIIECRGFEAVGRALDAIGP
jgi:uncharacterized protein (TIGR00725 family)